MFAILITRVSGWGTEFPEAGIGLLVCGSGFHGVPGLVLAHGWAELAHGDLWLPDHGNPGVGISLLVGPGAGAYPLVGGTVSLPR